MIRSKAQWYNLVKKNSKYSVYNLEKRNHKKNHIITLVTDDIREPKQILQEEKDFFQDSL